ncbi:MAG: outer membrane beta-barrel protein [Hyphomicrobium sp.]
MRGRVCGRVFSACLVLCGVALAAAGTPAQAQDWFRIPDFAYASDAELGAINRTGFILSPDWSFSDELKLGGTGGSLLDDPDGFAIGAKAGYDYQVGGILVGVITDAFYSFADGNGVGGLKSDLNYYGTVRGRLGVSLGRFLPYATAGYAYGGLKVTNGSGVSDSETLSGWTYGGGLEFVWNNDITLHGGYRRIDFDDATFSSLPLGKNTLAPEMDVIDFGLVRRF